MAVFSEASEIIRARTSTRREKVGHNVHLLYFILIAVSYPVSSGAKNDAVQENGEIPKNVYGNQDYSPL